MRTARKRAVLKKALPAREEDAWEYRDMAVYAEDLMHVM